MTLISSSDILAQMEDISFEPTRLFALTMGMMEDVDDGKVLMIDPSMPFPSLMEMGVLMSCAAVEEDRILNTRQYPVMANDDQSLYYHLSDWDFEGMFGSPGGAWFDIFISEQEILANAVQVGDTGTKRLTLGKHSRIVVNNMAFTFQYPINFYVKKHGSIDVLYDGSLPSPLQSLRGNKPLWGTVTTNVTDNNGGKVRFIRVRTFLKQMSLSSFVYSLSGAKSLKKVIPFTDNFYYVRAFNRRATGNWVEIKTSASQQTFDVMDPTLMYKAIDGELTIELPYVYFLSGLTSGDIRVDVYTTRGPINMALGGLAPNAFQATWKDLDNEDNGIYLAPVDSLSTISILSSDVATGGVTAPTFEVKRQRVLDNAIGDSVIPISDAQMGTTLADLGFDSQIVNDDLAHRIYLASRAMPSADGALASTGIDAAVMTAKMTINDLIKFDTTISNGERFTVTPKTLYRAQDGVLKIVSDADRTAIDALRGDALVNKLNEGGFLTSPFHYVLDIADDEFFVNPYFLTDPTIDITSYEGSNDTLGLTVSSSTTMSVTADEQGYLLTVKTSSNDTYKALADDQVHVQLAFIPTGESDYAYINGTQVLKSGERVFTFRIDTNWDLNPAHELITTNFSMYEPLARDYPTPLHNAFSLIWSVSNYSVEGMTSSAVDLVLGKFLLPQGTIGIYHEAVSLELGDELSGLWARHRSVSGSRKYKVYTENVLAFYKSNVYAKDPVTKQPIVEEVNGVKQLKKLHAKGDPVMNADGTQEIEHHINDLIYDENNRPIVEDERNVVRWWDVTLFDAVYRYATYSKDVEYFKSVPNSISDWVNDTLGAVRAYTLEETDLLFQPRNTIKYVPTLVDDSELKTLLTSQRLIVSLFVSDEVYKDNDLRASMKASTISQIVAGLDSSTVARNKLMNLVGNNLGTDVIAIKLEGLGGAENDYDVVSIQDESTRLVIAKSLEQQADGTYAVVDAIEVNIKKHSETA